MGYQRRLIFISLLKKEVLRFLRIAPQTLIAPLVTASLYLLIFGVSLGERVQLHADFSYLDFVVPGLILMGAINNSFSNVSSSLFLSRYIGNIAELLVTPISPIQMALGYICAAVLRGSLVAGMIFIAAQFFGASAWVDPLLGFLILIITTFIFANLGLMAALAAKNFDSLSMFTNFLIIPLIYLGGLFYPVNQLSGVWRGISQLNPLYYLIDAFRGACLGSSENSVVFSVSIAGTLSLFLFSTVVALLSSGYKLRQ